MSDEKDLKEEILEEEAEETKEPAAEEETKPQQEETAEKDEALETRYLRLIFRTTNEEAKKKKQMFMHTPMKKSSCSCLM